jgi:hypothetical protein
MTTEKIDENITSIEAQINERANQLLTADPLARELLGIKRGLEMSKNGYVENAEIAEETNGS